MIPFNKPLATGKEIEYIKESLESGKISGDGMFTKKCHEYFEKKLKFKKVLLTTSCTDALEMASLLLNIQPGDEVIMPAYTFVSTANAFVLRGAKIVFVDSRRDHPGMDEGKIEQLITSKTKAIVPVHYAGVTCNMDIIMDLAHKYNLFVIEDAAQAIDSFYIDRNAEKKKLGSIGHLGAFSFHETKNIISGEGGMLVINDEQFSKRAEIIREKGTNRSAFFRGEVDKYGWVDVGSSFLPSDMIAAYLYAQLENLQKIQNRRKEIWNIYDEAFRGVLDNSYNVKLPFIPAYATNNAHMYYMVCTTAEERSALIKYLKQNNVLAVFHYLSLNNSTFNENNEQIILKNSDYYTNCLVRLPLYYELGKCEQHKVIDLILEFYDNY